MKFDKYKIARAVTEVKNEIKNKEGGRDIVMSDYFKTLREPLIAQQTGGHFVCACVNMGC